MLCFGLNEGYTQFGLSAFTMHEHWVLPPVKTPVGLPGIIEGPAFMGWFGGMVVTHKVGKKTNFDGNPAVQQGHDCGYLIPHLQGPMNALTAVHILFSKHKVMFPVSKVLIEGKPLGSYVLLILGGLICANPVSLPTGVLIVLKCTVFAHMSGLDIFLGVFFIAIDVAMDALWNRFAKGKGFFNTALKKGSDLVNAVATRISSKIADAAIKAVAAQATKRLSAQAANFVARQAGAKLVDHVLKSWVVGPIFQGLVSLPLRASDSVPKESIPSIGVGRGNVTKVTIFPTKQGSVGN